VGLDLVEYNPDRDLNGVTAMTAAKIIKELLAKLL
jgi:arginase family enzyme